MRFEPLRTVTKFTSSPRFTPLAAALAGLAGLSLAAPAGAEPRGPATRPAPDARAPEAQVLTPHRVLILRDGNESGGVAGVFEIAGADGQPLTIRVVGEGDAGTGKGADKGDNRGDDDVIRRLRERRRAEESKADGDNGKDAGNAPGKGPKATKESKEPREPKADGTAREPANRDGGAADRERVARQKLEELLKAQRRLAGAQRQEREQNAKAAKGEKVAFLGINPGSVPPVLAKQLKLPADVGLVVEEVQPGSPAEQAGLRQYDVLRKLDEQVLIDPHQLVVLVRGHKAGDTIALSGVREGQPFETKVKLAEHDAPAEAEENEEAEQGLRYRLVPPGDGRAGPDGPGAPNNPRPWNPEAPRVVPLPLAPGAPVPPAPPSPRESRPDGERPRDPGDPKSEARPGTEHGGRGEPGGEGSARDGRDQEVRALEQQLQELRATAEKLRAEVREQEQQSEGDPAKPRGREGQPENHGPEDRGEK